MASPTAQEAPMTKVWITTLIPPTSTTDSAFITTWTEAIEFISAYSGTTDSHTLWRDVEDPAVVTMITGYPSAALNIAADKEFWEAGYQQRISALNKHDTLYWIDEDVKKLLLGNKKEIVM